MVSILCHELGPAPGSPGAPVVGAAVPQAGAGAEVISPVATVKPSRRYTGHLFKQGGGSSLFGKKNWKVGWLVVLWCSHGGVLFFKSTDGLMMNACVSVPARVCAALCAPQERFVVMHRGRLAYYRSEAVCCLVHRPTSRTRTLLTRHFVVSTDCLMHARTSH